ncbi:MAG: heavy metal translocating P-type ATPase [Ruminococcus sp.]|uniref:heavy metal translocating P-type ATPase n=1 Tax=Ruminococcus sp. TaxID=41978 RepID=UPI0025E64276|nr:heavy metal translocating P-type ATPase [Ruminococcus sp.]MCR5541743.1 heavy metal translocating P-type ATPase [Ruminococcus sp.]
MKCQILHSSHNRLRVHIMQSRMTLHRADMLEYYLRAKPFVTDVKVFDRTGDAVIIFTDRAKVIKALSEFSYNDKKTEALVPEHTGRELDREFEDKLFFMLARRYIFRRLIPAPLRMGLSVIKAAKYVREALISLSKGKIEVSLLDAVAITVSLIRRDHKTASSVMFMLGLGELLEDWTHKKSVDDLARTMSLGVEKVWLKTGESETLVPIKDISEGDEIIVRTGSMIPLDGKVVSGEAEVNQATLTGEALAVHKSAGSYAYAGTVVEQGSCIIQVDKLTGSGKYDRIVKMIEDSEKLKSEVESRAAHLADKLVPYCLGGTLLTYLLTRDPTKAISILMVDFSCALKLAMPISVISAMREGQTCGMTIKGGKFLEAVADADTIIFDKTGTLTHSEPKVAKVITFGENDEAEALRLAACLEEHYPHSIANAVVKAASERGLVHEELHSEVEYVVAHGIASSVQGVKVVLGSYHFVFEDENCTLPENEKFDDLPDEYSHLFLAVGGELAAVICIEDPIREEAKEVLSQLKDLGISKIVMMTGDSERTAKAVAAKVGVDEFYAEVLPEDKAEYVRREKQAGRKVIMIGDGVNDSPALSEADAGIAISSGAAIAREVADITISADDLRCLVTLRQLSASLMKRINSNYRTIIGFNFSLMVLGAAGVIAPTTSALLHNSSTLAISLASMRNYLK